MLYRKNETDFCKWFQRSKWFSGQLTYTLQAEMNPTSSTFLKNEHGENADTVFQRCRLITPVAQNTALPPEHKSDIWDHSAACHTRL